MYGRGGWMKGYVWEGMVDERICMWGGGIFLIIFLYSFPILGKKTYFI